MSTKLFREQRAEHAHAIKRLADTANKEKRDFSPAEQAEWDTRNQNYDRLTVQIRSAEIGDEMNSPAYRGEQLPGRHDVDHSPHGSRSASPTGDIFVSESGKEIRSIQPGESFRSAYAPAEESSRLSLGKMIRGLAIGRWDDAEAERREVQIGVGTVGGYLMSPSMSGFTIDLARNASAVMPLGVQTVPMDSQQMNIARVATDPTAYWRGESQVLTSSNMTLESLNLTARTLGVLIPVSLEMLEDAKNSAAVIENAAQQALGLELDRAILRGSGDAEEPEGIRNCTGVTLTSVNGALTYDTVLDGLTPIESANGTPNGWIVAPRTNGFLRKLKDGNNNYLSDHPAIAALQKRISKQVPITLTGGSGGSTDTEVYFGDFSKLLLGMRKQVTLEVFRSGTGTVGSTSMDAVKRLLVWVRLYMRADVHLAQPTHFNVLKGVTS